MSLSALFLAETSVAAYLGTTWHLLFWLYHALLMTAVTVMALYPLHQAFGVTRIFASSYQAVSGTGAKAIDELRRQVAQVVSNEMVTREVYPHQIAFNVLPQVDSFLPTGYTKEEMKMENEGR